MTPQNDPKIDNLFSEWKEIRDDLQNDQIISNDESLIFCLSLVIYLETLTRELTPSQDPRLKEIRDDLTQIIYKDRQFLIKIGDGLQSEYKETDQFLFDRLVSFVDSLQSLSDTLDHKVRPEDKDPESETRSLDWLDSESGYSKMKILEDNQRLSDLEKETEDPKDSISISGLSVKISDLEKDPDSEGPEDLEIVSLEIGDRISSKFNIWIWTVSQIDPESETVSLIDVFDNTRSESFGSLLWSFKITLLILTKTDPESGSRLEYHRDLYSRPSLTLKIGDRLSSEDPETPRSKTWRDRDFGDLRSRIFDMTRESDILISFLIETLEKLEKTKESISILTILQTRPEDLTRSNWKEIGDRQNDPSNWIDRESRSLDLYLLDLEETREDLSDLSESVSGLFSEIEYRDGLREIDPETLERLGETEDPESEDLETFSEIWSDIILSVSEDLKVISQTRDRVSQIETVSRVSDSLVCLQRLTVNREKDQTVIDFETVILQTILTLEDLETLSLTLRETADLDKDILTDLILTFRKTSETLEILTLETLRPSLTVSGYLTVWSDLIWSIVDSLRIRSDRSEIDSETLREIETMTEIDSLRETLGSLWSDIRIISESRDFDSPIQSETLGLSRTLTRLSGDLERLERVSLSEDVSDPESKDFDDLTLLQDKDGRSSVSDPDSDSEIWSFYDPSIVGIMEKDPEDVSKYDPGDLDRLTKEIRESDSLSELSDRLSSLQTDPERESDPESNVYVRYFLKDPEKDSEIVSFESVRQDLETLRDRLKDPEDPINRLEIFSDILTGLLSDLSEVNSERKRDPDLFFSVFGVSESFSDRFWSLVNLTEYLTHNQKDLTPKESQKLSDKIEDLIQVLTPKDPETVSLKTGDLLSSKSRIVTWTISEIDPESETVSLTPLYRDSFSREIVSKSFGSLFDSWRSGDLDLWKTGDKIDYKTPKTSKTLKIGDRLSSDPETYSEETREKVKETLIGSIPDGYTRQRDPDGRLYYYNSETGHIMETPINSLESLISISDTESISDLINGLKDPKTRSKIEKLIKIIQKSKTRDRLRFDVDNFIGSMDYLIGLGDRLSQGLSRVLILIDLDFMFIKETEDRDQIQRLGDRLSLLCKLLIRMTQTEDGQDWTDSEESDPEKVSQTYNKIFGSLFRDPEDLTLESVRQSLETLRDDLTLSQGLGDFQTVSDRLQSQLEDLETLIVLTRRDPEILSEVFSDYSDLYRKIGSFRNMIGVIIGSGYDMTRVNTERLTRRLDSLIFGLTESLSDPESEDSEDVKDSEIVNSGGLRETPSLSDSLIRRLKEKDSKTRSSLEYLIHFTNRLTDLLSDQAINGSILFDPVTHDNYAKDQKVRSEIFSILSMTERLDQDLETVSEWVKEILSKIGDLHIRP